MLSQGCKQVTDGFDKGVDVVLIGHNTLAVVMAVLFLPRAYARAVLGVVMCLSVCPSHAWIVTKLNDALRIF